MFDMAKNEEKNGFKFALTILAVYGTILLTTINYYETTAVDIKDHGLICTIITTISTSLLFLLLYIFLKGYSLEFKHMYPYLEKHHDSFASVIYLLSFLIFLTLILFIIFITIFNKIGIELTDFISYLMVLISLSISIKFGLPFNSEKIFQFLCAFAVAGIFWLFLFSFIFALPLGHINIDMENIYSKKDTPIPVSIRITGPNTPISIKLYEESDRLSNQQNFLNVSDLIKLNPREFKSSNYYLYGNNSILIGNSLGNGEYNIFINTTNLNEGFYELECVTSFDEKNNVKGFYLINSSVK